MLLGCKLQDVSNLNTFLYSSSYLLLDRRTGKEIKAKEKSGDARIAHVKKNECAWFRQRTDNILLMNMPCLSCLS